jgi:hypothetical protein
MGTISLVYPRYFKGKLHLKRVQKSDGIILKVVGPAVEPLPQALVVKVLIQVMKKIHISDRRCQ